jgi:hypothetical protein
MLRKLPKFKIAETVIFRTVGYGSESWMVRNKERKTIDAFELWTWRIILRVPWTDRKNERSSFGGSGTQKTTGSNNPSIKLRYFGRVMRSKESLERDIMLGQVAGHRKQGKPRMRWLDSIEEVTGRRLEVLKEIVQDGKKWRMLVEEKTRNRECTKVK